MKIVIIVFAILIALFLLGILLTDIAQKLILFKRGDGSVSIGYPSGTSLNLNVEKDHFKNNKGNYFSVYEYSSKSVTTYKGVILAIHGIGCGHDYIIPMIKFLCEAGYLVVAYDQFASGRSEGKRIDSMRTSTRDVPFALDYINKKYPNLKLFVFGHSWGGYAASISLHFSNKIEKAVILAGFDTEDEAARGFKAPWIVRFFMRVRGFLKYGRNGLLSATKCFKETNAKVLYIQGEKDSIVIPKYSGLKFKKELQDKKDFEVKMLEEKNHSLYLTRETEPILSKVLARFGLLGNVLVNIDEYVDFRKEGEVDKEVMKIIIDFLNK